MEPIFLSLQGGMAVGKTTAARYVGAHAPEVLVLQEDNAAAVAQVRTLQLDKTKFEEYIKIQRIYINAMCARLQGIHGAPCVLMDLGPEELEFYTLHYPGSIGQSWATEAALAPELAALRHYLPQRVLFLDAGAAALVDRKNGDATRDRGFFAHNMALLPQKRAWFAARPNTDFMATDGKTAPQIGDAVYRWVREQQKNYVEKYHGSDKE